MWSKISRIELKINFHFVQKKQNINNFLFIFKLENECPSIYNWKQLQRNKTLLSNNKKKFNVKCNFRAISLFIYLCSISLLPFSFSSSFISVFLSWNLNFLFLSLQQKFHVRTIHIFIICADKNYLFIYFCWKNAYSVHFFRSFV